MITEIVCERQVSVGKFTRSEESSRGCLIQDSGRRGQGKDGKKRRIVWHSLNIGTVGKGRRLSSVQPWGLKAEHMLSGYVVLFTSLFRRRLVGGRVGSKLRRGGRVQNKTTQTKNSSGTIFGPRKGTRKEKRENETGERDNR